MRQVFAVDGGRSCMVECRSRDRNGRKKRGRTSRDPRLASVGRNVDAALHFDSDEDWEETEIGYPIDRNRAVSWKAGSGLTICARNSSPFPDEQHSLKRQRQNANYGPWDSDEDRFSGNSPPRRQRSYRDELSPSASRSQFRPSHTSDPVLHDSRQKSRYNPLDDKDYLPRERGRSMMIQGKDFETEEYHPHRIEDNRRQDYPSRNGRPYEEDNWVVPENDIPPGFSTYEINDGWGRQGNERDHFERSLKRQRPLEDDNGRGILRTCYTCREPGHFSFKCPTRTTDNSAVPRAARGVCYNCGGHGHKSYDCPSKDGIISASKEKERNYRRCYNCYEVGHLLEECPFRKDNWENSRENQDCDSFFKTTLTESEKRQYLRENRCFTCGKLGHPYYSCPQFEKRLEYVFIDREQRSSWKLLRTPCWNYTDRHGDVHGPFSISDLTSWLEDGRLNEDLQVSHAHGRLEPIDLQKLVRISKSSTLVLILSCMPEAACFLGEEMDTENCNANSLAALQTKLHYDVYETTIRWLFINSMNEALQHYKSRRKTHGYHHPTAEDYSEPDGSGPPHSSDCDLSSPDAVEVICSGITNQVDLAGQPKEFNTMLAECEKYVSDLTMQDPTSNSLSAIQSCLHLGVVGSARRGILEAIIGEYLSSWVQKREEAKLEKVAVAKADTGGDSIKAGTLKVLHEECNLESFMRYSEKRKRKDQVVSPTKEAPEKEKQPVVTSENNKQVLTPHKVVMAQKDKQLHAAVPSEQDNKTVTLQMDKQVVPENNNQVVPVEVKRAPEEDGRSRDGFTATCSNQKQQTGEVNKQDGNTCIGDNLHGEQVVRRKKQVVKVAIPDFSNSDCNDGSVKVANSDLDDGMKSNTRKELQEQQKNDGFPEIVLHIFRKSKKIREDTKKAEDEANSEDITTLKRRTPADDDEITTSKRRVVKLSALGDALNAKATRQKSETKLDKVDKAVKKEDPRTRSVILAPGCSRSEGCARSSILGWEWREWSRKADKLSILRMSSAENSSNIARATRAQIRRLTAARFRSSRRKLLKFQRSKIHAWGIVTMEPIEPEDFVVEYIGELVRPKVADLRESRYQKQGLGSSYLFRVGEGHVIDATVRGGLARFINYSCEPNCYTTIINVDGQKRVFIYARKYIAPGTELTYDYKFPHEEQKIPCFCGSVRCRGYLN